MFSKKWLVGTLLCMLPIFSLAHAQERKVVQMRTFSVLPLNITLFPAKENKIEGRALAEKNLEGAHDVVFSFTDAKKAEVWRESHEWNADFVTGETAAIPFTFNFAKESISAGELVLSVEVMDGQNKLLAQGVRTVTLLKTETAPRIEQLRMEQAQEISGSVLFLNNNSSRSVRSLVRIREHSELGDIATEVKGEEISVAKGEQKTFHFRLPAPQEPELYWLEVQIVDDDDESLTGTLRQKFRIAGDFAEITALDLSPFRVLEVGDELHFSISGVVKQGEGGLEIELSADAKEGEKVVQNFSEKRALTAEHDAFTEKFSFTLSAETSHISATVRIFRNGKMIEEKINELDLAPQYSFSFLGSLDSLFADPSKKGNWEIFFVGFLTFLFLLVVALLIKGRQKTLLLFLAPLLFFQTANAAIENEWYHPIAGWGYSSASNLGFQTVKFDGRVYDNVDEQGLFEMGNLEQVQVAFGPNVVQVPVQNVTITWSGSHYEFEITAPAVADQNWTPVVTFTVDNTDYQSSWAESIIMDSTPPTATFSYNPNPARQGGKPIEFTNDPVEVTVQCTDAGIGCLDGTNTPFSVAGNYCDDADVCKTDGVVAFQVCDKVLNCTDPTTTKLMIDFYDPVAPAFQGNPLDLLKGFISVFNQGRLAATDTFTLEISGDDPDFDAVLDYPDAACGSDPFYRKNTPDRCTHREIPCVISSTKRGTQNQALAEECVGECGEGYIAVGDACVWSRSRFPLTIPFYLGGEEIPQEQQQFPLEFPFYFE